MWQSRNLFSRRFNLGLNFEDAFVTGYFGVHFKMSSQLAQDIVSSANITSNTDKPWTAENCGRMLSSLCEAVTTVPGGTLNVVEITAMGGAKWGAPGSIDFGDSITLRFRELSGMPVKKFITAWVNIIRHSNTALSMLRTQGPFSGREYTKKNFSADLYYWVLKPNGRDVEFAMYLHGVYPMSDLSSQISADLTTVDGVAYDVNFHVDALNWDANVTKEAIKIIDSYHGPAVNEYYNHK